LIALNLLSEKSKFINLSIVISIKDGILDEYPVKVSVRPANYMSILMSNPRNIASE